MTGCDSQLHSSERQRLPAVSQIHMRCGSGSCCSVCAAHHPRSQVYRPLFVRAFFGPELTLHPCFPCMGLPLTPDLPS